MQKMYRDLEIWIVGMLACKKCRILKFGRILICWSNGNGPVSNSKVVTPIATSKPAKPNKKTLCGLGVRAKSTRSIEYWIKNLNSRSIRAAALGAPGMVCP